MDNSFQSWLDRIGQWEIFETDWAHIRELAVMKLADLCALSVGINPQYAEAVDDLTTIDPDAPLPGNIAELAAFRNDKVSEWLRRRGVAMNHAAAGTLPIVRNAAPLGGHDPYEALPADAEKIVVRVADFVAWANGMGWKLPDEFPRPDAASYPVAPEGLQIGGGEDKALTARAETTYLNIIGGLLAVMLGKSPVGNPQSVFNDQAAIISALLAHYQDKPGIAQRTLEEKFAAANRSLTAT